jgi:hypothetical protein
MEKDDVSTLLYKMNYMADTEEYTQNEKSEMVFSRYSNIATAKAMLKGAGSKESMLKDIRYISLIIVSKGIKYDNVLKSMSKTAREKLVLLDSKYHFQKGNTRSSTLEADQLSLGRVAAAFPVAIINAHCQLGKVITIAPIEFWESQGLYCNMMTPHAGAFINEKLLPVYIQWLYEWTCVITKGKPDEGWANTMIILATQRSQRDNYDKSVLNAIDTMFNVTTRHNVTTIGSLAAVKFTKTEAALEYLKTFKA